MIQRVLTFLIFCAALGFAQVTSGSITVTASRTLNVQPDQAVYAVSVQTPLTGTRDDALGALAGSGITLANFTGVTTTTTYLFNNASQTVLLWTFTLPVAISDMKTTQSLLATVSQTAAKKNNGITVSFSVQTVQASPALLASQQCPTSGLLSDARTQAQTLASAANLNLGTVLALSAPVQTGISCSLTVKFAAFPY